VQDGEKLGGSIQPSLQLGRSQRPGAYDWFLLFEQALDPKGCIAHEPQNIPGSGRYVDLILDMCHLLGDRMCPILRSLNL